jgi:cell division septation protein DedD
MSDQNKEKQQKIKNMVIWGVPLFILFVLIVLLIIEITSGKSQLSNTYELTQEQEESEMGGVQEQVVFPVEGQEGSEPVDPTEGSMAGGDGSEFDASSDASSDAMLSVEEREQSYIVERGDSLWAIAQKKDLLDNPYEWKTILVQNKNKIDYTIISEETGSWKVIVEAGRKLKIKPRKVKKSDLISQKGKKRYALQLMSLELDKMDEAINIVKMLIKDGYYAYLYKTKEKIQTRSGKSSQYFYRIRTGFFVTEQEARMAGEEIYSKYQKLNIFPADYWPVLPSYSELGGELLDFGVQRTKPWIIQLSDYRSRKEAIETLKLITGLTDFAYISQRKHKEEGFEYRVRTGFFEQSSQAQKQLDFIQRKLGYIFKKASVMEIKNLNESLPGQTTAADKN